MSWAWSIDRPNLAELCERRIDRAVLAAAFIRGLDRKSDEWVLALTDGALWWLEIQPGRGVGGWKHWAELTDRSCTSSRSGAAGGCSSSATATPGR